MAQVSFGTNDVQARKFWSPQLDAATISRTVISKFFGKSQENVIQLFDDLERESGDRVRTSLRDVPSDVPFNDGANMEGSEYTLEIDYFDFLLGKQQWAYRFPNKTMDAQRVPYDLRAQGKALHSDFWRRQLDTVVFGHLCGFTPNNYDNRAGTGATGTLYNGFNTIAAYDSTREVFPSGETADEGLDSSGDSFTLDLLSEAIYKAKTVHPRLRTISVPGFGDDKFVCFLSPAQVKDLKASDTEWATLQNSLLQGGFIKDNPLLTGSLGVFEGTVLVESDYITKGVNSSTGVPVDNTRRAVLCGAQAISGGFGRWHDSFSRFDWVEKSFNYGESIGICSKVMYGFARTVYDSVDYGSILIHTYTTST